MATTIPPYVDALLRRQQVAAQILGSDVLRSGPELYNVNLTVLVLIGVIMKGLNDKGVILDAEWLDRLSTALDGTWPDWIRYQQAPPA